MSYNIVDHLHKMQVKLSIMEVMKIPQQKENVFRALEEETPKESWIEAILMINKPHPKQGRVPPFFISLGIDDLIIHSCMVDCGTTHNIMPLPIMNTIGLDCTRHYKVGECIFTINSRSVLTYGEIKVFCAKISFSP